MKISAHDSNPILVAGYLFGSLVLKLKEVNKMKKKGFTLIEVLVVAVIVAILAAVAIPAYMSYVGDSKTQVMQNTAATVATSIGNALGSNRVATWTACGDLGEINTQLGTAYTIKGIDDADLEISTSTTEVTVTPTATGKFKGVSAVTVAFN